MADGDVIDDPGLLEVRLELSADAAHEGLPRDAILESDDDFLARLDGSTIDRVRLHGVQPRLRLEDMDKGFEIDIVPLVALGDVELLRWTREQAISQTLHRHGNVRVPAAG